MGNPKSITLSVTATAFILSEGKSVDETILLGAAFTQLGDTLATIAAQKDFCEKQTEEQNEGKNE